MKKNNKKIIVIIFLIIVVLAALIYLDFKNNEDKSELFLFRENNKKIQILPSKNEITRNIDRVDSIQKRILPFVYDLDQPVSFIEEAESVASTNSLSIEIKDVETLSFEGDNVGEIVLTADIRGGLDSIITFLEKIENLNKDIKIKSLRIFRVFEGEGQWVANFILIGKAI